MRLTTEELIAIIHAEIWRYGEGVTWISDKPGEPLRGDEISVDGPLSLRTIAEAIIAAEDLKEKKG